MAVSAVPRVVSSELKTAIVVPTLNAGSEFSEWLDAVNRQKFQPDFLLLIDSESSDRTPELAERNGFEVKHIKRSQFDHGGTRLWAAQYLKQVDIIIYLTQDAILADEYSIANLLECFSDSNVASVYGRQLPADNATALAFHHRKFNYRSASHQVTSVNANQMGIRAIFCSNSFAAYRRAPLLEIGGFPDSVIMGEDMLAAKALIDAGYTHTYCSKATVKHSHNFSIAAEFKRYFDTGVFHSTQPEIRALMASTQTEGLGFVRSEFQFASGKGFILCIESVTRNVFRALGYGMGHLHAYFPASVNRLLSNSPSYWLVQKGGA